MTTATDLYRFFDADGRLLYVGMTLSAVMTADELRELANREHQDAAADFAARNRACEGALRIAEAMEQQGVEVAGDLDVAAS